MFTSSELDLNLLSLLAQLFTGSADGGEMSIPA